MPNSPAATESRGDTKVVEHNRYVDEQVRKTVRAVRAVDISQSVLRLLTVAVAVMLVVAVIEHWGIRGGLGSTGRFAVFATLLLAVAWWFVRDLWPLVRRGVNPVFAAQTIEQASPSLKNSLVNLLLLRTGRDQLPPAVFETIERQAAERLVAAPEIDAVDGRGLIRWGYLLVAVLAVGALYAIISPKNPFSSAARVLMPWAEIAAPTRVRISDVDPASAESTLGEEILVVAAVTGLEGDEQPQLVIFGGGDRDRRIAMTEAEGLNRFSAPWLPVADTPGDATVRYRIEAGDARSPVFRLSLVTAPAMAVHRVEYDYPDYTGYLDRVDEGVGDLRAIEGTRVTVFAEANLPIADASVDLQGDGRPDLKMEIDDRMAEAVLTLGLRDDRRTPQFSSYLLRIKSTDDRTNADPASYRVEVLPDYPPEAAVLEPEVAVRDVRLNETVAVRIEARDPDFALASVRVRGESLGDEVLEETLLAKRHEGRFEAVWRFTPAEHGLQVGEVVDYWVVATDVRTPEPHRGVSERQKFRIVSPQPGEPNQENAVAERNPGDGEQGEGKQGEEGEQQGEGEGGEGQPQEGQPQDGQSNQGESQDGEGEGNQQDGDGEQKQQGAAGEQQEQSEGGEGQQESPDGGIGSNEAGQEGGESDAQNGSPNSDPGGGESQQRGGDSPSGSDSNKGDSEASDNQQGGDQQKGGGDRGGESEEKPVSSTGDDDAEAFDRIREHLNEQGEGQSNDGQSGQQQSPRQGESSDQAGEGQPKPSADEQPDRESGDSSSDQPRDATNDRKQSDKSTSSEAGEESAGEDSAENSRNPREGTGGTGKNQAADEGNGTAGDQGPGEEGERGGDQRDDEGQEGEPGDRERGEGQQQRDGRGDEQGGADQQNSADQQRGGEGEPNQEGSTAENPSENGGDRPGEEAGGEEAGGESQDTEGSGDQPSGGDQADEGQSGENQRGGKSQENPAGPNRDPSKQNEPGREPSGRNEGKPENQPGERNPGQPGGDEPSESNPEGGEGGGAGEHMGGEPGGDEANLDYAREQTDLVLEKLSEQLQRKEVDRDLLERLGWSEEDLRRFVARWQSRKQAAQQRGGESQEQLDDALRSLGLKAPSLAGGSDARDDNLRDVTGGRRSTVPAKYRDRLRRYNEALSSGTD